MGKLKDKIRKRKIDRKKKKLAKLAIDIKHLESKNKPRFPESGVDPESIKRVVGENIEETLKVDVPNREIDKILKRKEKKVSSGTGGPGTGFKYMDEGGELFEPRGTDTVPAMLTPGEFVVKKEAVDAIGVDNLEEMNNTGSIPMDEGGEVPVFDARERSKKNY